MDIDLCPPWWPQLLWSLHFPPKGLGPGHPPSPVNYPPEINRILIALATYSGSYHIDDPSAALKQRVAAHEELSAAVRSLDAAER